MRTLRGPDPTVAGAPAEEGASAAERAQRVIVLAALAEGAAVGAWLALFPEDAPRAGGLRGAPDLFVRWAGLSQLLLAAGYALEWFRARRVALLVTAKAATALFLLALGLAGALPGVMFLALSIEAGIACAAGALQGPAGRARRSHARLRLVVSRPAPPQSRKSNVEG